MEQVLKKERAKASKESGSLDFNIDSLFASPKTAGKDKANSPKGGAKGDEEAQVLISF